jgi:hypothetical protein
VGKISDTAVPILWYGAGNNFNVFKKRLAIAFTKKYKKLG